MLKTRRYPIGAEVLPDGNGTHFRVWAPSRKRVSVMLESSARIAHAMVAEGNGYFSLHMPATAPGMSYRFRLDDDDPLYPDPASRFQPEGPHGPSQIVDPGSFRWSDSNWEGCGRDGQILYEMHIGTFTKEGTWAAAEGQLAELARIGVTCLEVMPVAEFPGRFGWGYDGVNLFAPTRLYGEPDAFRRFVDAAHRHGLGVILDVVYNHLGPDGNYLGQYSRAYFSEKHKTEWGEAINFDGRDCESVREYFATNAAYWIDEYHLDGLRLDATQNIYDDAEAAEDHILTLIGRSVRRAAKDRKTFLVAENEPQHPKLVRPVENGGYGLDALWNDDFHHSAMVALTGRNEAYYTDYFGTPQEFVSAIKYGYLYQGQWYSWQSQRRGQPGLDLAPSAFIVFIQNHDQVANSGRGLRVHQLTSPGRYRAMSALMLLAPGTPMLFQGQEFASSSPFHYFADHQPELAEQVRKGRGEFLAQFISLADPQMESVFAVPHDPRTFERCKLDFAERQTHATAYTLTQDLLRLRQQDPVFHASSGRFIDGAVLGEHAFVLRFSADREMDRLIVVNLGRDLRLLSVPEPLLATPADANWSLLLSTEDPRYGGSGTGPLETAEEGWRIAGESATILAAVSTGGTAFSSRSIARGTMRRIVY